MINTSAPARPVEFCGTIYLLTNLITGKKYVGQTTRPLKARINDHQEQSRLLNPRMVIHRSIKKHGFKNFTVETLATCPNQEALDWAELHFATIHNTFYPHGYNLRAGTGRGSTSEETKRKIGLGALGRVCTPETRAKISNARAEWHAGKSDEVEAERRLKISKANAQSYVLRSPEGERVEVTNLKQWCADNGFTRTQACKLALVVVGKDRSVKGWSLWAEPGQEASLGFRKLEHTLRSPEGKKVVVRNVKEFCLSVGLTERDALTMRKVTRGEKKEYKGWSLWSVD